MVSDPAFSAPHPAAPAVFDLDTPAIDCESAALFRAWLCPLLAGAQSWATLAAALDRKGFGLAIRNGRLVLIRRDSGQALCTLRFLGTSLREMAGRLGRPMVKAQPGRDGCGEFLTATPPHLA